MSSVRQNTGLWDLYTLKHEYPLMQRDGYKSYYRSQNRDSILEPAVSRYLVENKLDVTYPGDRKFAVCLTHDIDVIYPTIPHRALSSLHFLRGMDLGGLKKELFPNKSKNGPGTYINFREIMEIEEAYGAKSSFYFMARCPGKKGSGLYDLRSIEDELGHISDRGWEIGLHGGYYAYDDLAEILEEKRNLESVLGKKVTGYRNHYLCFKIPDTWELLARAGFEYDTTLGYNNMVGFRNGMCHPFRPFNLKLGREIDIVEIPLTIMDRTLFSYGGSPALAWEKAKLLVDTVERYHGVITLLWHNTVFGSPYREEWKRLYSKILDYCRSKNAWMTSAEEIAETRVAYACQNYL